MLTFILVANAEADMVYMPPVPEISVPADGAVDVPIDVWTAFAMDGLSAASYEATLERLDPAGPVLVATASQPPEGGVLSVPRENDLAPNSDYRLTMTYPATMVVEFRTGEGRVVIPSGDVEATLDDVHRARHGLTYGDVTVQPVDDPFGLVRIIGSPDWGYTRVPSDLGSPIRVFWQSDPPADERCVMVEQLDGHGVVATATEACAAAGCATTGGAAPRAWVFAVVLSGLRSHPTRAPRSPS